MSQYSKWIFPKLSQAHTLSLLTKNMPNKHFHEPNSRKPITPNSIHEVSSLGFELVQTGNPHIK